jgi:hypothetical protein
MTTLRHGDRSQAVQQLQKSLNARGAQLLADGYFGDDTEALVRAYQVKAGLIADGIAGPKTLAALAGADITRLLTQSDLLSAASQLGVELAAIMAVNEVESLGEGFLPNGKPKILYERHVMYRLLGEPRLPGDDAAQLKHHADQLAAASPNLVNPKPGGYAGGVAEHQRLAQARLIDANLAAESASWGAFQIMGYHWQRLGYASVDAFVSSMCQGESEQLAAFVAFIQADSALLKALKGKKWADFAKRYNGPDYARNLYDVKLDRAYQRHAAATQTEAA